MLAGAVLSKGIGRSMRWGWLAALGRAQPRAECHRYRHGPYTNQLDLARKSYFVHPDLASKFVLVTAETKQFNLFQTHLPGVVDQLPEIALSWVAAVL